MNNIDKINRIVYEIKLSMCDKPKEVNIEQMIRESCNEIASHKERQFDELIRVARYELHKKYDKHIVRDMLGIVKEEYVKLNR